MGPGTHLKKRLARGDKGINRLDKIARIHDIDYSRAKSLQDKWVADRKMVKAIDGLPGRNTPTEFIVKNIMSQTAITPVTKQRHAVVFFYLIK